MKGKYLWSSGNVWRAENAFDDRRGFFYPDQQASLKLMSGTRTSLRT